MSDTPGGTDWIQASDGRWYPRDQIVGWERRADGKWYEVDSSAMTEAGDPTDPPSPPAVPTPSAPPQPVMTLTTGGSQAKPLSRW